MKLKDKDGKQRTLFDEYHRALDHDGSSGTTDTDGVVDFLSELREQRTSTGTLLTKIIEYENVDKAFKQVKRNKGSSGVDRMDIAEAHRWLSTNEESLRTSVLRGEYRVDAVRKVEIPKANGGKRMIGIPTVIDRMIQQAIHQKLSPLYDRHFSANSYGFRSGRNAHQAVRQASEYVSEGREWVVDIDLGKSTLTLFRTNV